jgi:glycosyltransferase involved in cell wall biosynthesis
VRSIYDLANSTIVLSKERENQVAAICRRSNVYRLHNFAALPTLAEDEGTRNYSSRRNVVLFLGEVGRRKGAFDIPAIIELVATTVRDVLFIVAGNGAIGAVKDMIEAKGCGKNAIFTGWIGPDAKKESLLEARVFLLPSYNEEFPMSVLEAMSYGLPVVSTRVGGVPELVVDDVNGYLFDPGDVKGIADAIVALLEDSAKAYAMGRTNMEKMRSRYSLDAYADELETIYKETVKLGAARSMTECNT